MKLIILDDYDQMSDFAAKYVCRRINAFVPSSQRQKFVLGLPTGSSPLGFYKKLVELYKERNVSFQNVCTFNMDEYVGIPIDHTESYHSFMFKNFFKHIDIDPLNIHILDGTKSDLELECPNFEKKIVDMGGIDLFVGGLGSDGHVAFNEPGTSFHSTTHIQALNSETIQANSRFFGNNMALVPQEALTVGIKTIYDSREVLMIVNGQQKSRALHKSIESGISHTFTASFLQMHPNTIWVVDDQATYDLKVRTYKHFKEQLPKYKKELFSDQMN